MSSYAEKNNIKLYVKIRSKLNISFEDILHELVNCEEFNNIDEKYVYDIWLSYYGSAYKGSAKLDIIPSEIKDKILLSLSAFKLRFIYPSDHKIWIQKFKTDFGKCPDSILINNIYTYFNEFWLNINEKNLTEILGLIARKIRIVLSDEFQYDRTINYKFQFFKSINFFVENISNVQINEIKNLLKKFFYPIYIHIYEGGGLFRILVLSENAFSKLPETFFCYGEDIV